MKSMKRLCVDDSFPDLRVIAVSATVPNLDDFGQWLSNSNGTNAIVRSFGEEFRPVQLQRHVFGYPEVTNQFAFEDNLKYKLFDIIKTYSNSKPLLIFCSTRKSTLSAAEFLCQESIQRKDTFIQSASKQALLLAKEKISDKKLQDCIVHGVAFHNAGMAFEDRRVIEELFLSQHLLIVCTTSTLAVGVNLPAHLVIINTTFKQEN
jgi:ATP-dependent DNA helicase HFM1/MER3